MKTLPLSLKFVLGYFLIFGIIDFYFFWNNISSPNVNLVDRTVEYKAGAYVAKFVLGISYLAAATSIYFRHHKTLLISFIALAITIPSTAIPFARGFSNALSHNPANPTIILTIFLLFIAWHSLWGYLLYRHRAIFKKSSEWT